MKKRIFVWKIMISMFLMVLIVMPLTSAEKKIFHGTPPIPDQSVSLKDSFVNIYLLLFSN